MLLVVNAALIYMDILAAVILLSYNCTLSNYAITSIHETLSKVYLPLTATEDGILLELGEEKICTPPEI